MIARLMTGRIRRSVVGVFSIVILSCLPFVFGCNSPRDHLNAFNQFYEVGDYENASMFAEEKISEREKPSGEDLLWSLQLAAVERARQNYDRSTKHFDESERMLKYFDQTSGAGDVVGSTVVNDNVIPYGGEEYDGVMVNSAALWPLLLPQWKDPKKWWKQLATAKGRKDYDWSHLAARYFPTRVADKCKEDPSLAVAHKCFWRLWPEKACAWELRLQDEIRLDFTIDEPGSEEAAGTFLAEHPDKAEEILAAEVKRRERKAKKEAKDRGTDGPLFDTDSSGEGVDD